MRKREFLRFIDRAVITFSVHEADSPRGLKIVNELEEICSALGLSPDETVVLATRIGTAARGLREVGMRALATNLAVQ
jgi:hypothetical protein